MGRRMRKHLKPARDGVRHQRMEWSVEVASPLTTGAASRDGRYGEMLDRMAVALGMRRA
jgi:hypothetical protein